MTPNIIRPARNDFREELFRHREKYIVSRITFRRVCNHCPIKILLVLEQELSSSGTLAAFLLSNVPVQNVRCPWRAREDTWETDQRRGRFNVAINNRYLLTETSTTVRLVTFPRHPFQNLSRGFCRLKLVPSNRRALSYPRRAR